eukprot:4031857-Pyramimonas_sp.AAC.1
MHLVGNTRIFLWVLDTGCKPEKCAGVRPIVLCVARPPVRPTKKFMVGRNKTTAISIGDGEVSARHAGTASCSSLPILLLKELFQFGRPYTGKHIYS